MFNLKDKVDNYLDLGRSKISLSSPFLCPLFYADHHSTCRLQGVLHYVALTRFLTTQLSISVILISAGNVDNLLVKSNFVFHTQNLQLLSQVFIFINKLYLRTL